MTENITTIGWLIAGLSAFLIGLTKTGVPGVGILVTPLMAMVLPAKASTGVVLPMLIFADVISVAYFRRYADWRILLRLMPWALVGIVLGWLWMGRLTDRQLKPILGIIVLVMLAIHYIRQYLQRTEKTPPTVWWFAALVGIIAGVTTMLANAAGPIMILYLLAMRLEKQAFMGTAAWYFLILNWVKVPFCIDLGLITTQSLSLNGILAPAVVAGAVVGIWILRHISQRVFEGLAQFFAFFAALYLIFSR